MKTKAELIQALIVHAQTAWKEDDKALLESFSEAQLGRLVTEAEARTPTIPGSPMGDPSLWIVGHSTTQTTGSTGAQDSAPVTLEAIQALLTAELDKRDQALEGRIATYSQAAAEQTERSQLTAHLLTQGYAEKDCATMTLEALRRTVHLVAPVTYAGLGFPHFPSAEQDDANLPDDEPEGWKH